VKVYTAGDAYRLRYSWAVWRFRPKTIGERTTRGSIGGGVRVEAKLPMRRRGGRRIKKSSWSTMSLLGGSLMCVTKDKTGM
jgi:hypothetical protein